MCKLKSGIILKDRVYIPDHDHHTKMLEELKIADTRQNAERLFVRAELYPKNGDMFTDPDTWVYHVDQDILPDWYVAEVDEARMREAVKAWHGEHVHIDEDDLTMRDGVHWIKGGKNIDVYGSATVEYICDSAMVKNIYGSATVIVSGIAKWHNRDKAKVTGNATIKDTYSKQIIQAGDWTLIKAKEE